MKAVRNDPLYRTENSNGSVSNSVISPKAATPGSSKQLRQQVREAARVRRNLHPCPRRHAPRGSLGNAIASVLQSFANFVNSKCWQIRQKKMAWALGGHCSHGFLSSVFPRLHLNRVARSRTNLREESGNGPLLFPNKKKLIVQCRRGYRIVGRMIRRFQNSNFKMFGSA